jgi:predicted DNA-binding transcriptional regulator AlpA
LKFRSYVELHASGDAPWSRDHLRRKCNAGEYPKPVVLSRDHNGKPSRTAWVSEEIEAYKAARLAERDGEAHTADAVLLADAAE